MRFFDRLSAGWNLGMTSLKTIRNNPELMLFPIVSSVVLIAVVLSFVLSAVGMLMGFNAIFGDGSFSYANGAVEHGLGEWLIYVIIFAFYVISYFLIIFFNVGLVYCSKRIFEGEQTSFKEGFRYATSRTVTIFMWAILAGTVGFVLKMIQERGGAIGNIVSGLVGIAWSVATFFVVPVLAYEDVNPIDAIKRSGQLVREQWGEALGANFGLGIFSFLGFFIAVALGIVSSFIHPLMGIITGILAFLFVQIVVSAARMVFISATYQHVHGDPYGDFDSEILDSAFVPK